MNKEFVPYEQALELKELGFDEECWCYFINDIFNDSMFLKKYEYFEHMNKNIEYTLSPLYSQVFRWFREKYDLMFPINKDDIGQYYFSIPNSDRLLDTKCYCYASYEEAEFECLKKLIEIIKNM